MNENAHETLDKLRDKILGPNEFEFKSEPEMMVDLNSIPKPLVSICLITTKEDMEKFGQQFLKYLPKSTEVELVILMNKKGDKEEVKLIKEDVRISMYDYTYEGSLDFAHLRNKCREYAKGEWILSMDIDDILLDLYHNELLQLLKEELNTKTEGIRVGVASSWYNRCEERSIRENVELIKIYKNKPENLYYGALHELVEWSIDPKNVLESTIQMLHFGYDISTDELRVKMLRNMKGLCKLMNELKDDEPLYPVKFEHYSNYLTNTIDFIKKNFKN